MNNPIWQYAKEEGMRCYHRDGTPYGDMEEWAKDFERFPEMRRVAETMLPDGKWVSTIWLGIDHSFGSGPPLIFETMVFPSQGDWAELDMIRYSTEAAALEGHAVLVKRWEG